MVLGVWYRYHRKKGGWNKLYQWNRCADHASPSVVPVDDGGDGGINNHNDNNNHNNDNHNNHITTTHHINENERRQSHSHSQYSIQIFASSEKEGSEVVAVAPGPPAPPRRVVVGDNNQDEGGGGDSHEGGQGGGQEGVGAMHDHYDCDNRHVHVNEDDDDVCVNHCDNVNDRYSGNGCDTDDNHKKREDLFGGDRARARAGARARESNDHGGATVSTPTAGGGPSTPTSSPVCVSYDTTACNTATETPMDTRPDTPDVDGHHTTTNGNTSTPNTIIGNTSTPNTITKGSTGISTPAGSSNCGGSAGGSGQGKGTIPSTVSTTLPETPSPVDTPSLIDGVGEEQEEGMNIGGIFASLKYF